ncbi:MAG: STAS domain-containing protein [Spirochaetia bacterium]|jgi:anti-anti-sigma factor
MFDVKQVSKEEVILAVTGALSGETAAGFHHIMEELASGKSSKITLDLSKTPTINSSVLGKILLFRKKLAEQERTLQIRGCSEGLFKTFQMIKFDTLISIKQ